MEPKVCEAKGTILTWWQVALATLEAAVPTRMGLAVWAVECAGQHVPGLARHRVGQAGEPHLASCILSHGRELPAHRLLDSWGPAGPLQGQVVIAEGGWGLSLCCCGVRATPLCPVSAPAAVFLCVAEDDPDCLMQVSLSPSVDLAATLPQPPKSLTGTATSDFWGKEGPSAGPYVALNSPWTEASRRPPMSWQQLGWLVISIAKGQRVTRPREWDFC